MKLLKRLFQEEEGVTLIEYGLIAALIAVMLIGALALVEGSLNNVFTFISGSLENTME